MRLLTPEAARAFLLGQGLAPGREVDDVLSGFDFMRPAYEHHFFPGDELYQLIRLPSVGLPSPQRGNWYALAGLTHRNVAVSSGLAGRRTQKFEVVMPFLALEGTAKTLPIDWRLEIGGPGGGTQIYVPRQFGGRIRAVGPVDDW